MSRFVTQDRIKVTVSSMPGSWATIAGQEAERENVKLRPGAGEPKFFLTEEYVIGAGKLKKLYIKLLRLVCALMPLAFIRFVEDTYLKKHHYQQLIVLACKRK